MGARDQIGRYELVSQIAQGEMGKIYLGRTMGLGGFERHVVIKTLEPESEDEQNELAALFLEEARVLGMLHHQHIAPVLEIDEDRGRMYMAMEYVHGKTAADVWSRTLELGAALPIDFCLSVVSAAAAGLHYAHTRRGADGKSLGIVHRDVSLTNLMIGFDGAVKLIDFGIAKASGRRVKTQTGFVKGKIGYMAPEQVRRLEVDARTDVFALGIVLYELTTMARAFREESDRMTLERVKVGAYRKPTELNPDYPKELEKIVTRALRVDPRERFPDAESMRAAIEALGHKYDLVLGDAAVSEIMHQLFEDRREPWQSDQPPPPLDPLDSLDISTNPPAAPRKKPLRTATDNAEALGKEIDAWAETVDAGIVPPDAFDDEQATAISTLDPKAAFANAARSSTVPVEESAIASERTTPDGLANEDTAVRAKKIERLFTESSFNPTETPPKPLDVLPSGVDGVPAIRTRSDETPPAIERNSITEKGIGDIGPIASIADTTDGVTILPASAVTGIAKEREAAAKEAEKEAKGGAGRILLIALALIVAGGIAIAAVWFFNREEPVVRPPDPADAAPIVAAADAGAAAIDAAEPVAIDASLAPPADAGKTTAIDAAAPVIDAAPGSRTIAVKLTSTPSGATVTLDGLKRLGKTPFDAPVEVPPGSHSLRVRMMGFNTIEIKIAADDKSVERDLAMIKVPVKKEDPKPDDESKTDDKKDKKDEPKTDDKPKTDEKKDKKDEKKAPPPDDDLE